jgi:uncharacterized protein YjiS (DUF1127 family)
MQKTEKISYPFVEVLAVMLTAAYEKARDALRAYVEARAAATTGELQHLSDHVLRDIGLHRSQLDPAARGERPWW